MVKMMVHRERRHVQFMISPQIQNTLSKALKGTQTPMARQPQVTRTITTTKARILVLNIETGISEEREVSIPREFKKMEKLRKAIEDVVNTNTVKFVHILSTEVVEILYGMTEQKFIENAEILPARGTHTEDTNNQ